MCRNHSHITAEITGTLRVGETDMMEVRMRQPLEMQLPYGEKWIKSATTTLYVPVSMRVPLPASVHRQMEVCYTPFFYAVVDDMTTMRETLTRLRNAGATGHNNWTEPGTSAPYMYEEDLADEPLPW